MLATQKAFIFAGVIIVALAIAMTALSGVEKTKKTADPQNYKCPNPDINIGLGSTIIVLSLSIISMGLMS